MKVKGESEVAQSCPTLSDPYGTNVGSYVITPYIPEAQFFLMYILPVVEIGKFYQSFLKFTDSIICQSHFTVEPIIK